MQSILPLFAILIIFALRSDAQCSIRCPREELASSTPHCVLYGITPGRGCRISGSPSLVQRVRIVYLTVDLGLQHTEVEIHNFLAPNKLEIIFNRMHTSIESLILHNDWIRISSDSFRYLPNLKSLTLSETALDRFPHFSTVNRNLEELILHNFTLDTLLTRLPSGYVSDLSALETLRIYPHFEGMLIYRTTLANLPALASLYLSNVTISGGNILANLNSLENITVHYAGITDVSLLAQVPNPHLLRVVDFDFNKISSIEEITRFTGLRVLGLYTNLIDGVSRSNFTGLSQLTFLNLPGNNIDAIWEDTFRDLPSLVRLNLDENPLVTLSPRTLGYLPHFQTLKLPQMHCDCNLQWLSIVHTQFDLSINTLSVCGSPSEFGGLHVFDPSIYESCSSPYKYSCFDKNRDQCKDGAMCRDTAEGYECVCEGENMAYSHVNGGKCVDIDEIRRMVNECVNGATLDENFTVECKKRGP